jgi:hypothetical protein
MTTTTTTTTTTAATATAKKQYTFGVSESMKAQLAEFRMDFTRPAAVKNSPPVPMSEKECLEVLFQVASDRRFKTVEVLGEDGLPAYDADGLPEFKTLDLVGDAWEAIKVRDYSETINKSPTIAGLEAQIRKYGKALNLSESSILSMIEAAKAGQATA